MRLNVATLSLTLICLIAACHSPPALSQTECGRDLTLEQAIERLGMEHQDVDQEFQTFDKDPRRAVAMLVQQLHPIAAKAYFASRKTKQSEHIVWCLRALHYLTGMTFTAGTRHKLNDQAKQFLDFKDHMHDDNPDHKLHFFGVWMSRDAEFVAPLDTQRSIIAQWRQWQDKYGTNFQHVAAKKPSDTIDQWYWYG